MNVNIDILSLFFLGFVSFWYGSRCLLQINRFKTVEFFITTHVISVWALVASQAVFFQDLISMYHYEQVLKVVVTLLFSLYLALVTLLTLDQLEGKKIKTIWRIPLIGFLAGLYFDLEYIAFICMGHYVILHIILWKRKVYYRYLRRYLIYLLPVCVALFFIKTQNIWEFNLIFIWLVVLGNHFLNLAHIRSRIESEESFV